MIEHGHERRVLAIIRQLCDGDPVPYDRILQAVHPRFNGERFVDADADDDPSDALSASELDQVLDTLVADGQVHRNRNEPHLYTPRTANP